MPYYIVAVANVYLHLAVVFWGTGNCRSGSKEYANYGK